MATRPHLTTAQRRIASAVAIGAALLAAVGFAGSYQSVRHLAEHKGFGEFAVLFPLGVDAGIGVLLALDLLLTWLRIPFPLLRPAAWLLTAATIGFNAAAAWPDPIGVGMHAAIPVLFVVVVEAGRHTIGRLADITADRHAEPVRLVRWLLAPAPTFKLWRRMRLWELRSYGEALRQERDRLVYRAQLRARYGRAWRRRAPVAELMPLRLTRYGQPLHGDARDDRSFDEVASQAVAVAADEPPATPAPVAQHPHRRAAAAAATPAPVAVHETVAEPETPDATPQPEPAATPATSQVNEASHLTVADVAAMAHVTEGAVRTWVQRKKLIPAKRDARGRNLFDPVTVADFLKGKA